MPLLPLPMNPRQHTALATLGHRVSGRRIGAPPGMWEQMQSTAAACSAENRMTSWSLQCQAACRQQPQPMRAREWQPASIGERRRRKATYDIATRQRSLECKGKSLYSTAAAKGLIFLLCAAVLPG